MLGNDVEVWFQRALDAEDDAIVLEEEARRSQGSKGPWYGKSGEKRLLASARRTHAELHLFKAVTGYVT